MSDMHLTFKVPSPGGSGPTPTHSLAVRWIDSPVPPKPRKRRGLTGKAYRSARRQRARLQRAYDRGVLPGIERLLYVPNASVHLADEGAPLRTGARP